MKDDNMKTIIAERLSKLLKEKNLMQKDLANVLGLHPNIISYFITGKRCPNPQQLVTIAKTYNVTTDYLLGIDDSLNNEEDNSKKHNRSIEKTRTQQIMQDRLDFPDRNSTIKKSFKSSKHFSALISLYEYLYSLSLDIEKINNIDMSENIDKNECINILNNVSGAMIKYADTLKLIQDECTSYINEKTKLDKVDFLKLNEKEILLKIKLNNK